MNNKLSIEEFRKYKEQLQKIIDDFKNNYEVMKNEVIKIISSILMG